MKIGSAFRRSGVAVLLAAFCTLFAGCAATRVQQVWRDESFHGTPPNKVFIIALVNNQTARRQIESEFAKRCKARGMAAAESFRTVSADDLGSNAARDAVVVALQKTGAESVIITRVIAIRKETETIPGMTITRGFGMPTGSYGAWGGYSAVVASFPGPTAPTTQGYSYEQRFLVMETQVFDVGTEKLVWAVRTETRLNGSPQEEIVPYVSLTAGALFSQGPW
jgi:hypothetical protein